MTRMTGPDYAVMCFLINTHTHKQTRRGMRTLLVEAGAGGWRGLEAWYVEKREQWEHPLATQPDRQNGLSQTNRGVGGGRVGVMPRVQSKLSRTLHA